ncbi:Methionyl-tRNA synthetase [Hirschfeldia incana]|nr:Methionyl-tRNA synthetase [Hirschfeldia incana]
MGDKAFATGGANKATFGFVVERDEAESPLAFYVYRLNHSAAVRTRPWSCVPSYHPLVLIAHEHQTHPCFVFILFVKVKQMEYLFAS